jgi:hypothetical protein
LATLTDQDERDSVHRIHFFYPDRPVDGATVFVKPIVDQTAERDGQSSVDESAK